MASGLELRAKRVVSSLGYRATEALLGAGTPAAPRALATPQSAGFVMANVALRGSAAELGISAANTWIQPANAANHYDALDGELAYFSDPLGVDLSLVPVGITFPSAKEEDFAASAPNGAAATNGSADGGEAAYHTCQILALAEYRWFEKHAASDPAALAANGARHAPPHVARKGQAEYDAMKLQWGERLVELLYRTYPGTRGHVAFTDVSTPLTLETYLRAERGAGVGLDVTPQRFVSASELAELDMKHPRVPNLWRCGQDYLMCGQVLSAASGIVCALRMRGPLAALRFVVRAARLLLICGRGAEAAPLAALPVKKVA